MRVFFCDVVILVYIFVLVSLSWCNVFLYGNPLYIFLMVFLQYLLVVSLSRCFLLRQSTTCLCLDVFCYGNLLHVFVSVSSTTKISYMTLSGYLSLWQSFIRLCLGVFCYKDLLHIFCDYLVKGNQLFLTSQLFNDNIYGLVLIFHQYIIASREMKKASLILVGQPLVKKTNPV